MSYFVASKQIMSFVSILYFIQTIGMQKEKQSIPDYLDTPRSLSANELMLEAIENYEKAELIYNEAVSIEPISFNGSKYQIAEHYYYQANNCYVTAAEKGWKGASTLAKDVQQRIHEIERKKLELNPEFYSLSQGFVKSLRRTERAYTMSGDAQELITWPQLLQETSLVNIKKQISKKEQEAIDKLKKKEEEIKKKYEKNKKKNVDFKK